MDASHTIASFTGKTWGGERKENQNAPRAKVASKVFVEARLKEYALFRIDVLAADY